jgi:hypothetical protein
MEKNLWIYDKAKRGAIPQAMISMYITTSAVLSIALFFFIFMFSRSIYGYVPKPLTMLSMFVIIGVPGSLLLWNYSVNASPKIAIRAYPIYLDSRGELWMFDYNSQAFEDYYDAHALPSADGSRTSKRFRGTHKERTVEFCVANNSVLDIIKNPPYDAYAHHIVQIGKIVEKGGYLRVQFLCHSEVNNKDYAAGLSFPLDMTDIDTLRAVFERKASGEDLLAPKAEEHTEPGLICIDRIIGDEDGYAVLHGIMEAGTIARGDLVCCTDGNGELLFECRASRFYHDGREIVWATPVKDGNDPGYEIHIKGRVSSDFRTGNQLRSK